jgi:beta-N-acetylhexosaminidase
MMKKPSLTSAPVSCAQDSLILDVAQQQWVEKTFASLSLQAKIGQLMHPMLTHYKTSMDQKELIRSVIDNQVGGAFLFCRPYKELREVVRQVTPHMEVPIVLSGDYELGANTIDEGVRFGSPMGLAAIEDLEEGARLAYQAGKAAAVQGAAVGATWTFAPVVDINTNHQNPITNIRSYGDDVERIVALSTAYVRGVQDHGMAACIKHFPGDGQDARDQHVVTSINPLSLEEWEATYGRTFRAGIQTGTYTVMMGHIAMPHWSSRHPKTGLLLPATLDAKMQVELLRNRLGFQGVIISDAIVMGVVCYHAPSEADLVVQNLATGSDMVLFVTDVKASIEAVRRGLDEGAISQQRIDDAVRRVLTLKAKLHLNEKRELPSDEKADEIVLAKEFAESVTRAGEKCVTLIRDLDSVYPLKLAFGSKIVLFSLPLESTDIPSLVVGDQAQAAAKSALQMALEARGFQVAAVYEPEGYEREVQDAALVIYTTDVGPQASRGSIRLSQRATLFLELTRNRIAAGFPSLFVSYGSPYVIWEIAGVHNFVCCYSHSDNAQRALVKAMLGEIPFAGKLPVKMPELY